MVPTRVSMSLALLLAVGSLPVLAGPTSHAMELEEDGSILFVDIESGRLLRLREGQLSVVSQLEGVPEGDAMHNLIRAMTGEVYLGQKKTVWKIGPEGDLESVKPPAELKTLFANRPGDLAPDGSIFVARDFKNIQRSLPGGDAHPVLVTDMISRIYSMSATPYGRLFFANNTEIAKLDAKGEVEILQQVEGEKIYGLAALGENAVLVLRQRDGEGARLEKLDTFGKVEEVVSAAHIAAVSPQAPVEIASASD